MNLIKSVNECHYLGPSCILKGSIQSLDYWTGLGWTGLDHDVIWRPGFQEAVQ